ncbi:CotH kinase family protein [Paenibacillus vulneris]|uniref:CotH kinase family protein n=1 Tax=Paenibacillus vulneris TaxID=1133364 RepID=UPI00360855D3
MKAKAITLLLCICLILGITGCGVTGGSGVAGTGTGSAAATSGVSSSKSDKEKSIDENVFPKDKVIDVNITLDPDDFQDMLDNASAEEFKTASVDYNGKHIDHVAVRTKGNLSLRSVVNSDSDRYSFKIAFDEYISSQSLEGITKINLNNNYSDPTYMREFLAYELAEQMGLPTPKYSYVNLYVNNELKGLYLAVEQLGESYLERNFGSSNGALYKANGGNGSELNWLEKASAYTGLDLKSGSTKGEELLAMVNELNNGTDYEKVLDVEEALRFIALNMATANMDSYLGGNKHNYYLYENKGIFSILPWDYNMAFGGLGGTGILMDEPTQGAVADRPLVDKLLKVDKYKEQYHQIVKEMVQGYLSEDKFVARVQELADLISDGVAKDPTAFYTYDQYQQGITQLQSFNSQMVASLTKQLDGTSPSSGDGSGSGGGMGGGMPGGMGGGMPGMGAGNNNGKKGQQVQAQAVVVNGQVQQNGQGGQQAQNGQGGQQAQNGQVGQQMQNGQGGQQMQNGQGGQQAQNGQGGQQAQNGQGGQQAQNGQGGQQAQNGQGGQQAQNGQVGQQMQNGQVGQQMQNGPGGRQGGPGGGFGGPGGGGPGGPGGQQQPQGSASEAMMAGAAFIALLAACFIVVFYKRKRL